MQPDPTPSSPNHSLWINRLSSNRGAAGARESEGEVKRRLPLACQAGTWAKRALHAQSFLDREPFAFGLSRPRRGPTNSSPAPPKHGSTPKT
jgi:hypothetical protein